MKDYYTQRQIFTHYSRFSTAMLRNVVQSSNKELQEEKLQEIIFSSDLSPRETYLSLLMENKAAC